MDSLGSYIQDDESFACPLIRRDDPKAFGYSMSEELTLAKLSGISNPEATPLIFDSSAMLRNATSTLAALPLPPRHRGGRENNIVYADGRVKAVESDQS